MFASTKARIINFVITADPRTLALGVFITIAGAGTAILNLVF